MDKKYFININDNVNYGKCMWPSQHNQYRRDNTFIGCGPNNHHDDDVVRVVVVLVVVVVVVDHHVNWYDIHHPIHVGLPGRIGIDVSWK